MIGSLRSVGGRAVDVIVIGAGHAGLAFSRCLADHAIDHAVLERGEIANAWRHERWDSLRLLTPNWQSRLPGLRYTGDDPDGFMTAADVAAFIDRYAATIDAPVYAGTTVTSVQRSSEGYRVCTDRGDWRCAAVVLANGANGMAAIPAMRSAVPASIAHVAPIDYRNPNQLEAGGVLVVGASATGLQLADEIRRSGREVTLAVGEHIRLPRMHRGRDILYWMDAIGVLDERYDRVDDLVRARRVPSPQLVGTPERADLDLNSLQRNGVHIVGRLMGVRNGKAQFSGALRNHCAMADLKMSRLFDRIDHWIDCSHDCVQHADRLPPTRLDDAPPLELDLRSGAIRTIVWATGYRPDYRWLDVPVFDRKGRIRHDGGVVASAGMYVMGLTFMRRRKSSFIYGTQDDARELSDHLADYLKARAAPLQIREMA